MEQNFLKMLLIEFGRGMGGEYEYHCDSGDILAHTGDSCCRVDKFMITHRQ
jgi:hypothetical protein